MIVNIVDMGAYNYYIWPAYGITLIVFMGQTISACCETYQIKKRISAYLKTKKEPREEKNKENNHA